MDTKNKNNLSLTFSLSHFLTFSPAHRHTCSGFTLVEIMVTLCILGVMGAVAGGIYLSVEEEKAYEDTVVIMQDIRKAILGTYTPHIRGIGISGYVADMGGLPALNGDGQLESLWKRGKLQLPSRYYPLKRIWAGWNGPYIQAPESGFLTDGWGNGISFRKAGGSLIITSYGADKKLGGASLDQDITIVIKKEHYMAPVGGHVAQSISGLSIHYPTDGVLQSERLTWDDSRNFMSTELDVPIGLRSITANIREKEKVFVFSVQPAMNWIGTVR
ncbi:MAG: type II secretion system protein GspG, partial [Proteobacteria bacterium]|nr:type II secretion system protein GspG [Pseudomonadota bacterium]